MIRFEKYLGNEIEDGKVKVHDWSTPELVKMYIKKYELYLRSAEIEPLSNPELVKRNIEKYKLSSESVKYIFSILRRGEK